MSRSAAEVPAFADRPTLDEEWADIAAREIPGFAGYVTSADGAQEMLLADLSQRARAEAYVRSMEARSGGRSNGVRARKVAFGFDRLMHWRLSMLPSLGRGGIHFMDIDEANNRISLRVATEEDRPVAERLARMAGIPTEALSIEVAPPGEPRATLRDGVITVIGGYQIQSSVGNCSVGFNTLANGTTGVPVFITASHCTVFRYGNDNSAFRQPNGGLIKADETNDPSLKSGYFTFNGQSYVCQNCRFSDATMATYRSLSGYGNVNDVGLIAKTDGYQVGGAGSIQVIGSWEIFNKLPMQFLTVGRWVNKMGQVTGWTRGQVARTCFDHFESYWVLRCQWEADVYSTDGDSGAPIFLDADQNPTVEVSYIHLGGLLWGGPGANLQKTWFSSMDGIERDFGMTLKVCRPSMTC